MGGLVIGGSIGALGTAVATENGMESMYITMALFYIAMVPLYLLPFAVWKVGTTNYVFSATRVEDLQFKMQMKVWAYWWIMVSNAFLALITLGLAIPWTKIRMMRYQASCLSAEGKIGVYRGTNVGGQSATGDEIGDAFDIDFGF